MFPFFVVSFLNFFKSFFKTGDSNSHRSVRKVTTMKRNRSERISFVLKVTLMIMTASIGSFYLKKPQFREATVMEKASGSQIHGKETENDARKSLTSLTVPIDYHEETRVSSILVNNKESSLADDSVKKPVHKTHEIKTVTKTIIDKPAWNEEVPDGEEYVCNYCGEHFRTVNELKNHCVSIHNEPGSYTTVSKYRTVHHDAITHAETTWN